MSELDKLERDSVFRNHRCIHSCIRLFNKLGRAYDLSLNSGLLPSKKKKKNASWTFGASMASGASSLDRIGISGKDVDCRGQSEFSLPSAGDSADLRAGDSQQELSEKIAEDVEKLARVPSQPLHSIFSQSQKYFITAMVTFAAFFSPLSSSMYFPILNKLAANLNVSNTLINLTITSYMIFQGLAPMMFGTFSDQLGRRPAYITAFTIYLAANIGLALQNSYVALFMLRCLQSTGSSGTIAIGVGVISDIATSAERGSYMGMVFGGVMLGPAMGPVIGGLLSHFLGWQSIFWFLAIGSGVFLTLYIILVDETGRKVVGNGSKAPPKWNMSLFNWIQLQRLAKPKGSDFRVDENPNQAGPVLKRKESWPNPFDAIYVLLEKDVGIVVVYNGLILAVYYDIVASLPSLFKAIYGFDDLHIGLCYL